MSKKNRRSVVFVLVAVLALLIILPTIAMIISYARAVTSEDIQKQIDSLKEEASDLTDKLNAIRDKLQQVAAEERSLSELKKAQDEQIELTRLEIENTVAQIQQYGLLIASKQEELDNAVAQEAERRSQLQSRLRAMEENGSVSYIAIVFKATSFSDLLDRIEMVNDLMSYDQSVLDSLKKAQEKIDAARESLEKNKEALNSSKALLEEKRAQLAVQIAQADETLLALHEEKKIYAEEYEKVEQQENEIWERIDELTEQYEKVKAAEVEAARKAAIEAAKKNNSSYTYNPNSDSSFAWPVSNYTITSQYGMRYHPILGVYKLHTGVDIGASSGSTIRSAKSGWVTVADYSYAYGNYVVVSHGNGEVTLYAHMSSYTVSAGDYVLQGSTLGYVGSTGYSTGPHLHFEIRINGAYTDPLSYFNLNFYFA